MKVLCIYNGEWQMIESRHKVDRIDFRKYVNKKKESLESGSRHVQKKRR